MTSTHTERVIASSQGSACGPSPDDDEGVVDSQPLKKKRTVKRQEVVFAEAVVAPPPQLKGAPKGGWKRNEVAVVKSRPREGEKKTKFCPADDGDGHPWTSKKLFEKFGSTVLPNHWAFVRFVAINSAVCWIHVQTYTTKTMTVDGDDPLFFANDITVFPNRVVFNIVNCPIEFYSASRPSSSRVHLCHFADTAGRLYRTFEELFFTEDYPARQDLMLLEAPIVLGHNQDDLDWDKHLFGTITRGFGIPKSMKWSNSYCWNYSYEMMASHGACLSQAIPPLSTGKRLHLLEFKDTTFVDLRLACRNVTQSHADADLLYGFVRTANEFIAPSDLTTFYQAGTSWKLATDCEFDRMELDPYAPMGALPETEDDRLSMRCPSLFVFLRKVYNLKKGFFTFKPLADSGVVRFPPLPLDGGVLTFNHFAGYLASLPQQVRFSVFGFHRPDACIPDYEGPELEFGRDHIDPGFVKFSNDGPIVFMNADKKAIAHVNPSGVFVAGCAYDLHGKKCKPLYETCVDPVYGVCLPLRSTYLYINTLAFAYAIISDAWSDADLRRLAACTRTLFFRPRDDETPQPEWLALEEKLKEFTFKQE